MTDLNSLIQSATRAMCEQRFVEADAILKEGLKECSEAEEREIILQHLVHVYEHPLNQDLGKAELYMSEREALRPSAYSALANAYFQLYSRRDSHAARTWAETASRRALEEHDLSTLYSASALAGLLAAGEGDLDRAKSALDQIESLLGRADEIVYADAVVFLESLRAAGDDMAARAKLLAASIAPTIEDTDFRSRAEVVAGLH
jgi:ATP/maltotriose-dependent transcriptional regulator MalT